MNMSEKWESYGMSVPAGDCVVTRHMKFPWNIDVIASGEESFIAYSHTKKRILCIDVDGKIVFTAKNTTVHKARWCGKGYIISSPNRCVVIDNNRKSLWTKKFRDNLEDIYPAEKDGGIYFLSGDVEYVKDGKAMWKCTPKQGMKKNILGSADGKSCIVYDGGGIEYINEGKSIWNLNQPVKRLDITRNCTILGYVAESDYGVIDLSGSITWNNTSKMDHVHVYKDGDGIIFASKEKLECRSIRGHELWKEDIDGRVHFIEEYALIVVDGEARTYFIDKYGSQVFKMVFPARYICYMSPGFILATSEDNNLHIIDIRIPILSMLLTHCRIIEEKCEDMDQHAHFGKTHLEMCEDYLFKGDISSALHNGILSRKFFEDTLLAVQESPYEVISSFQKKNIFEEYCGRGYDILKRCMIRYNVKCICGYDIITYAFSAPIEAICPSCRRKLHAR